jgi:hypothetical protein
MLINNGHGIRLLTRVTRWGRIFAY